MLKNAKENYLINNGGGNKIIVIHCHDNMLTCHSQQFLGKHNDL